MVVARRRHFRCLLCDYPIALVAFAFAIAVALSPVQVAFADEDEHSVIEAGVTYKYILESGEATVTSISKAEGNDAETFEAVIPESVEVDSESYCVTAIGPNVMGTLFSVSMYGDNSVKDNSLVRVVVPSKCLSVGDQAFVYCEALTSLEFACDEEGDCNIQSIGERAFAFTSIETINLPDTVANVGAYAFTECGKLESLRVPARQTVWGMNAFLYTSAFDLQVPEGCVTLPALTVRGASLSIPSTVEGSVRVAGSNLTSVMLPSRVRFDTLRLDFLSLESLVVPEGVEALALSGSCQNVELPKSLVTLMSIDDDQMSEFVVPEGVETIDSFCFSGCVNLERISFEDGSHIHSIGSYAFSGCHNLQSVDLPVGLMSIGSYAFSRCSALKEVEIPASVESAIGVALFDACNSLVSVRFAEGSRVMALTAIAADCPALETVVLPDGITDITRLRPSVERYLFRNCPKLSTIVALNPALELQEDDFSDCGDFTVIGWGKAGRLVSSVESMGNEFCPIAELDDDGLNGASNTAVVATGPDSVRAVCAFGGSGNFPYVRTLLEGVEYTVRQIERDGLAYIEVTGASESCRGRVEVPAMQDIALAEAGEIGTQISRNGAATRPAMKLALGGRSLVRGRDFTVEYRDNDRAGTAVAVATGIGSYTGQKEVPFEVAERHELSATGTGTSSRINAALAAAALPGMPETCKAVVVAWAHDHAAVASACALAVAEDAQLLVVSNAGGLTDAQKSALAGWGSTRAIIVGGASACGSMAVSDLEAAGLSCEDVGFSASAVADAAALSAAVASAGSGKWGSTAVVANPSDPTLCLAAAAYAGAVRGPLVLTQSDGILAAEAISALSGFDEVALVGDLAAVDASVGSSLSVATYRVADSTALVAHGKQVGAYSSADATYAISVSAASVNMSYAAAAGRAKAPLTVK